MKLAEHRAIYAGGKAAWTDHRWERDKNPYETDRAKAAVWEAGRLEAQAASMTDLTTTEALRLVARTTFRPFGKADWDSFAGCEGPEPLIGETGDYVLVIDGPTVNIIKGDDMFGGMMFDLNEM